MSDQTEPPQAPEHHHQWRFLYTYADWWDGDEEDVYECIVEGCKVRDRRYAPR